LSNEIDALNLPPAPEELLRPLVGEKHGGQLLLTSDRSRVEVDPEISRQGVIFTDLKTAERDHPDLLIKILGRIVQPDEGKFASLSAAFSQNGVFIYVPNIQNTLSKITSRVPDRLAFYIMVWLEGGLIDLYTRPSRRW
jgi:Fe-S cluster assembly scaffold protein SufB